MATTGIKFERVTGFPPFDWECPHCHRGSAIDDKRLHIQRIGCVIQNTSGPKLIEVRFFVCPSQSCKKYSLNLSLYDLIIKEKNGYHSYELEYGQGHFIKTWNLIPESSAKSQPEYIPAPIREDYTEACLTLVASPKASATLSRRCLSSILMDFWGVKDKNLFEQIGDLEPHVESGEISKELWTAIDGIRRVGKLGAHLKLDANQIPQTVSPDEAKMLIGMIEILFDEWYVIRERKRKHLEEMQNLGSKPNPKKQSTKRKKPPQS